ncbi:zinc finger, CCHC-type containing protein [Tanacetum coccineum]
MPPAENSAIRTPTNHGKSLRTSPSTTMKAGMKQRIRPSPQPQALETTFEARVRDYMAAHTERMERFENAIFKQREGINSRMTEMFGLLKELTTSRTPEKVLIREEAKFPVTKNHKINEKLIKGLVDNNRFNNSLSGTRVGKKKGKTYKVLPRGPVYDAILKKKIMKKEDIRGNFEIPCNIGGQKGINSLVNQGSDVNVMPYTTYMKLTNERPAETDIRLSLASHSYIYPLGIAEDVLVEVAEHVYPIDFVILDIKENEKRPFILGTPFLTTAMATIRFNKGTITLRSGKSKEEKIKLHLEKEVKFNQWRSKSFKGKHPTLMETKEEMDDEGEVTLYLMRRSLEVLRKFHWMILGGRFNQLSHVSSPLLIKPGEY